MTGSPPELRSFLEAEMFYGVKKRERIAYLVAGGGLAIGLMGMIAVVSLLPLKQTEAFLAIVDKDTGVAERVVAVEKAGIEQAEDEIGVGDGHLVAAQAQDLGLELGREPGRIGVVALGRLLAAVGKAG